MVIMFLAQGFEETEAILPLDLIRRAGIDIKTVSINENIYVTGSHGITVKADMTWEQLGDAKPEMVILPGGPGTENLDNSQFVKDFVVESYNNGSHLAAICAAPMVLGKLGLLNGKLATCYPGYEKYLYGAKIRPGTVMEDRIITSRGIAEAYNFAYSIIAALKNKKTADDVSRATLFLS